MLTSTKSYSVRLMACNGLKLINWWINKHIHWWNRVALYVQWSWEIFSDSCNNDCLNFQQDDWCLRGFSIASAHLSSKVTSVIVLLRLFSAIHPQSINSIYYEAKFKVQLWFQSLDMENLEQHRWIYFRKCFWKQLISFLSLISKVTFFYFWICDKIITSLIRFVRNFS